MKKEKLVLIDGNSIAFRAFYALPLLTNARGVHTNAIYGFAMMLMKIIEEEEPTHMLVAFDAGRTTFRHDWYPEYKGTRDKTPDELSEQIPLIHQLLDAFQIQRFELENYEADDIIGTLAKQAEQQKIPTIIISGDKDLLQLVSDQTHVMITRRGVTDADRYDPKAVEDRYGLTPAQVVDLKGLMGDSSDHIPGIPGVGEKTAIKLLKQFPTVEEVLEHQAELPGKKLREKVSAHQELAKLSKKLATINTAVPMTTSITQCQYNGMDHEQVIHLCKQLEFKTLLDRLMKGEQDESSPELDDISVEIVTEENRDRYVSFFDQDSLAFFVEGTQENPHHSAIVGMACSDGKTHLYIPWEIARDWSECTQWLQDENKHKIVYDAKKLIVMLRRDQIKIEGIVFDLHLAGYLLDPSDGQLELSSLVHRYIPQTTLPTDDDVYGKGVKRKRLEGQELAEHLARKTSLMIQLHSSLSTEVKEKGLDPLYRTLEMPLVDVLAEMELEGVAVDKQRLEELGEEFTTRLKQYENQIYRLAGTEFNINSPKQLAEVLFNQLGLPVLKKTKTGASTSADVLEKLAPQHEIVELILHYRQVGKLLSTYIEGLKKEIQADGKIHTQFQQTIAATGRLSSIEPNLQNIPIRLEEGRQVRQVFIPSHEQTVLLSADYSQVELRVLAHLSADESLIQAFQEDRDIHTQTAMDVFEVEESDVTSLMRRHAKAVNFGIVYGISDFGLSQSLNISRKEAKTIIERYFSSYPKVKQYMEQVIKEAKELGYVTTMLGRRRYLPNIRSRNFNQRSFAERTAMNTPIQGTAADIIKAAMIQLAKEIKSKELKSRMLLQVHDELILEVPEDELDQAKQLVKTTMEQAIPIDSEPFKVKLQVDINFGKNWYEAK